METIGSNEVLEVIEELGGAVTTDRLAQFFGVSAADLVVPVTLLIIRGEVLNVGNLLQLPSIMVTHATESAQEIKAGVFLHPDYSVLSLEILLDVIGRASEELAIRTSGAEERLRKAREALA